MGNRNVKLIVVCFVEVSILLLPNFSADTLAMIGFAFARHVDGYAIMIRICKLWDGVTM